MRTLRLRWKKLLDALAIRYLSYGVVTERYVEPFQNDTKNISTLTGFHASSQPTHVDQEVQFFLEVNIPLNTGSRSVQMRGRHSAVKIHMNDRMHALLLASGKLSRQRRHLEIRSRWEHWEQ